MKKTLFVDMDGVLADFYPHFMREFNTYITEDNCHLIKKENFFATIPPMNGSKHYLKLIWDTEKYDIHILSQPYKNASNTYAEKVDWIMYHFPYLSHRIHLTQHKELFSRQNRLLLDDRPEKWKTPWENNGGTFLSFPKSDNGWEEVYNVLK